MPTTAEPSTLWEGFPLELRPSWGGNTWSRLKGIPQPRIWTSGFKPLRSPRGASHAGSTVNRNHPLFFACSFSRKPKPTHAQAPFNLCCSFPDSSSQSPWHGATQARPSREAPSENSALCAEQGQRQGWKQAHSLWSGHTSNGTQRGGAHSILVPTGAKHGLSSSGECGGGIALAGWR